ncbi:MAG: hypothetical protein NZ958_01700 [Bacteroidia bacterium]|nr:hypothetical protein [Bacteroidia bacterium]MDW8089057.1 hypothetical protein [Bacteroidia bacterium]
MKVLPWFLGIFFLWGCRSSLSPISDRSADSSPSAVAEPSKGLVERIADSLEQPAKESAPPSLALAESTARAKPMAGTQLPPLRREPWMDTLLDLSHVPPPNSAVELEEEAIPQNLSSVEILLSHRLRPTTPLRVTLRAYIGEEGRVRRIQILETSDTNLQIQHLVPPLLELRCSPATNRGRNVASWIKVKLHIKPL